MHSRRGRVEQSGREPGTNAPEKHTGSLSKSCFLSGGESARDFGAAGSLKKYDAELIPRKWPKFIRAGH